MNKKINIYLLMAIMFLQGLVFYGPISTLYRQSRGLSIYNTFLIESIFMVLLLTLEIPWGWFADRYGYKLTLIIAYMLLFISKIVFYIANSFSLFLFERVLLALAFSGISGCDIALLYSSMDKDKSEKIFSFFAASESLGCFLAALISMVMVAKSMDLAVFYTIIPHGIIVILTFFLKDTSRISKEKSSISFSMKDICISRQILIIIISIALIGEVTHSIGVFLNQLQYMRAGINIKYFGLLAALMQLVCLLSAKAYKFTERFGQKKTIRVLINNVLISCIVLAYVKNPLISIFFITVIEGSYAIAKPIVLDIENRSISSSNRATVLSTYAIFGDIASSLVNLLIGKFADYSVESSFGVCAGICAIAYILARIYFK